MHVSVANIPGKFYLKNVHILIFERKKICMPKIVARTVDIMIYYLYYVKLLKNIQV